MTNNYKIIRDAIVAKLQALTTLKYVYPYEKGELEGYPAATIYSATYVPAQTTTQHDIDVYEFTVHIYQEQQSDNTTPAQAEEIVDAAMVEIIQAFQQDPQISLTCDNCTLACQKGWVDREMINRAAVVTITATKLVQTQNA